VIRNEDRGARIRKLVSPPDIEPEHNQRDGLHDQGEEQDLQETAHGVSSARSRCS